MALDFSWQDGERVMFVGDGVTEDPQGYTRLVPTMVTARYPERHIDYFPRGMGGNRVGDLLERLDRDVLGNDPPPTWISLSVGLNDAWHGATGTPVGRFQELYDTVLMRLQDTKATIVCFTTTVFGEELDNEQNVALDPYNDVIRRVAFGRGAQVVDMNAAFKEAIRRAQAADPNFRYTVDNEHLDVYGQYLMSLTLLGALNFGLSSAEA